MSPEFVRARLSPELESALRGIMTPKTFARGAVLYRHGTSASGIYVIEQGSVRILLPTADNKHQLLEVAGNGAVLGLSESMSGGEYRVTAEADDATRAAFISRENFAQFLDTRHEFCMQVVRLLSENLHGLYHKFRNVSAHPGRPRRRVLDEQLN